MPEIGISPISPDPSKLPLAGGTMVGDILFDVGTRLVHDVQVQNLVDKTAAETVSGIWTHSVALNADGGVERSSAGALSIGVGGASTSVDIGDATTPVTLSGNVTIPSPRTVTIAAMTVGSVLFAGTGGLVSQDNAEFFFDNTADRLQVGGPAIATKQTHLHVAVKTTVGQVGSGLFEGPVAIGNNVTGATCFASDSIYLALVLGNNVDGDPYGGGGNGALYAGVRFRAGGGVPLNEPYVGMSQWDFGAPYAGATDTGRTIYYGGGGWAAPDAHNHQFYVAPGPYSETNDTGTLILAMTNGGGAIDGQLCVGGTTATAGGKCQILGSSNSIALHQRTAAVQNRLTSPTTIGADAAPTAGFDLDVQGGLLVAENMSWTGDISPAALAAGTTQNYAPASLATSSRIRQAVNAAGSALGGLTGGADGRIMVLVNISTGVAETLTLNHEDAGSTAANRFLCPAGAAVVIPNRGVAVLQYDATDSRWRVVSVS